jgi:hypothetical protein
MLKTPKQKTLDYIDEILIIANAEDAERCALRQAINQPFVKSKSATVYHLENLKKLIQEEFVE